MNPVEGILFDFGGTLFDYSPTNGEIWAQVVGHFGKEIEPNDPTLLQALAAQTAAYDQLMLTSSFKLASNIPEAEWRKLNEVTLSAIGINDPQAITVAQEAFAAREGGYTIFPDTIQTLNELKQLGKHIGLVSNSTPKGAAGRRPILQQHGILSCFETIVLSSEVGVAKPDREIFEIALRAMNLKNSQRVWHIGDDFIADVLGAKKAGITPVLLDPAGLRKVEEVCIRSLSEIVPLVREFEES